MKNILSIKGFPIFTLVAGIILLKLALAVGMIFQPTAATLPSPREALAQDAGETNGDNAPFSVSDETGLPPPPEGGLPAEETQEPFVEEDAQATQSMELESRRIERERNELELLRTEVEGKIKELEAIQANILALIAQLEGVYDAKEKHLIKILSGMPPKKAAPMMDKLDLDLVVKLFAGMKSDQVGQILPYLDPEKAAKIGEKLTSRVE